MPGEDTNELMKLRAVQGELTDLPVDNSRATLSSRIRALLLKETGIPQLAHLYGALELNKSIELDTGENLCYVLHSDGTNLYVGLYTTPGKIVVIDLHDFTKLITITLNTGEDRVTALVSAGDYLYAALFTVPGKIVKIDKRNFTEVDTLTLAAGEDECLSLFSDGTFLFTGTYTSPAKVIKIDLDTFTEVDTLTLAAGEDHCYAIYSEGIYLYAGLTTAPGKVVKINKDTFTSISTLDFYVNEDRCRMLVSDGRYLYAGLYMTNPARVIKIDINDFTRVDHVEFDAGETHIIEMFIDGTYLYAGLSTAPGKFVTVDLSSFEKISTYTFSAGDNYCNGLFIDGTYTYIGLRTSPAKIFRRYIIPSGATYREREIDRVYERNVEQSMPLAMYGKVTIYTDTTHFKASILTRFGDHFFDKWFVYVVRDAGGAGAAPEDELVKISDYVSADGTFTHAAFTVPLAVSDEILILHKSIGSAITSSTTINNIFSIVNALLTLTETGGTITTDGALQSLYINNAPAGIFQPRKLLLDFTNHAIGDVMVIRTYYRINPTGGLIKQDEEAIVGPQDPATITIYLEDNRSGYEITIEKTVGANLTYDWEVIYKA